MDSGPSGTRWWTFCLPEFWRTSVVDKGGCESPSSKYKTQDNYIEHIKSITTKSKFDLHNVTITNTKKAISKLKNKSSSGSDTISNKTIKALKNEIAAPLNLIINTSINTGKYPTEWKTSKVIPLFKANDKDLVSNYRPISLQNVLSKVLERTVKEQVTAYLEREQLLPPHQFGFREKMGLNHLHFDLNKKIIDKLTKKQVFKIALLDFSKAFDLVSHDLLLLKLEALGFGKETLNWFKDYLHNRKLYCLVNKTMSDLYNVTCGVPQGTCLGPLLFLCYTFDIIHITENYSCFADDTSIYGSGDDEKLVAVELEHKLSVFQKWVENNRLELNWKKSKVITLGSDNIPTSALTKIKIKGCVLDEVDNYKLVGITIDRKLSWTKHIEGLCNSLNYIIYLLNRVKNYTPFKTRLLIYNSLFQSKLSFGMPIWSGLYKGQLKQLEILQKKAVRAVYKVDSLHHTEPLFQRGHILKLESLIKYHNALLARSCRVNPPINISKFLSESEMPPGPLTRRQLLLDQVQVPNFNKFKYIKQPTYAVPKQWNNIPCEIKFTEKKSFKKHLKEKLHKNII